MTDDASARSDAALAGLVSLVVAGAFVATGARPSPSFLALGAGSTLLFEFVAARDPAAVRRRWRRPTVRAVAVVLALALVAGGALVAPSRALSAAAGALVAYLGLLFLVWAGAIPAFRS